MQRDEEILETLCSVTDYVRWGASQFGAAELCFGHGTDNAADEAAALVLHALHLDSQVPEHFYSARLTPPERHAVLALLWRRIRERKPAAYLTHRAWFADLEFYVDERVLVPRSPIAELILERFAPWCGDRVGTILDLCTGSGCIAIGCAHAFPAATVTAVDVSSDALEVAAINVERHALQDRVQTLRSNLFAGIRGRRFDLVVSNPPYVSSNDPHLKVLRHEPQRALIAGVDGLAAIGAIANDATSFLKPGGLLIVEHGHDQGRRVRKLFAQHRFHAIETHKDLAGLERVTTANRA